MQDNGKLVFDFLHKLQKWDNELFINACYCLKKFSLWDVWEFDKIVNILRFYLFASLRMKTCHDFEENPGL